MDLTNLNDNNEYLLKMRTQRSKSCWDEDNKFNHVPQLRYF